jgi:fatty acid-binding protein DegV
MTTITDYKQAPRYCHNLKIYGEAKQVSQSLENKWKACKQDAMGDHLTAKASYHLVMAKLLHEQGMEAVIIHGDEDGRIAERYETEVAAHWVDRFHALSARNVLYGHTGQDAMAYPYPVGGLTESFRKDFPF